MRVVDLCRGSVSQLNDGSYSHRGGRRRYIHLPERVYSVNQNCQEKAKKWSNDMSSMLNPRN
jgi:predicted transcriptional regulator